MENWKMLNVIQNIRINQVMLFKHIMKKSYLQNKFASKFHTIATIQLKSPIEFLVNNSKNLYHELNNFRIMVLLII